VVRVGDGDHGEFLNPGEVFGVAGVKGEIVGDGDGGDHGVVGTRRWFSASSSQTCGYASEATGRSSVKGQRVEVGFCLLEVRLPCGAFLVGRCHQWTHGEFGEGDGGDQWVVGERIGVVQPTEQDERAGVEDPARHRSQGRIEDLVEVVAQLVGIDRWKLPAAGKDHLERYRLPAQWSKLSDRFPGAGDRESLAFGCSVDHVAAVVAEFPDRDFRHACSVSRVIQEWKRTGQPRRSPDLGPERSLRAVSGIGTYGIGLGQHADS
jgi:hypothetical protein